MSSRTVELRCPVGPRRLLAKAKSEATPTAVVEGNLIELACRDCAKNAREFDPTVIRVLHRFDILGRLIESEAETSDGVLSLPIPKADGLAQPMRAQA